jgi:amino acid adenylation domain-containing protein
MSKLTPDFSLTMTQRDIYFDQAYSPDAPFYNIGGCLELGKVELDRLRLAHKTLVQSHDAFGIRISSQEHGIRQYIVDAEMRNAGLPLIDMSQQANPIHEAREWVRRLFETPIPYECAELFQAYLIKLSGSSYWYTCVAHHLALDGVGFINWARTLARYYDGADQWPAVLNWREVVATDESYIVSERYCRDRDYWKEQLHALPDRLLSSHYGSLSTVSRSFRHVVSLGVQKHRRLQEMASASGVGISHILLGVLASCLGFTYSKSDMVIGLPVHNRRGEAQKQGIGVFTSVSPIRLKLVNGLGFSDFVRYIAERQKSNFRHQKYPMGDIVRDAGLAGEIRQIYDVGFSYLKFDNNVEFDGNLANLVYVSHNHEATPLMVTVWECGDTIDVQLDCNRSYFNEQEMNMLGDHLVNLLNVVMASPETSLSVADVIPAAERTMLLQTFNACAVFEYKASLLHAGFEASAADRPDALAVITEEGSMTYGELNRKSNRLAHELISRGVGPEERVAICVDRGLDMIVGIIAILKAGGACVPMDPNYPDDRLRYMLQDCAPCLLLTQQALHKRLSSAQSPVLLLDDEATQRSLLTCKETNPETHLTDQLGDHLAYVIYTSGSTGQPKGVMVSHNNFVVLIEAHIRNAELTSSDRVLQFGSISFDSSVEEIFSGLSVGASLVIRPSWLMACDADFEAFVVRHAISVVEVPTAFWHQWAQLQEASPECLPRLVVIGGEKAERRHLLRWKNIGKLRGSRWLNSYGPTECSVYATAIIFDEDMEIPDGNISIGRPTANARVYILNQEEELLPLGAVGEICIAGPGVGLGYWRRPELTAERFRTDPFHNDARMYKTGDLGRWLPDGTIEYCGRNDFQVKIRGFRIELGEIETKLVSCVGIREALVMQREDIAGEPRLVAYLIGEDNASTNATTLRLTLAEQLPEHMIPSAFVMLDSFPMSPNGKLDRKAFPAPTDADLASREYEAPQGAAEASVAEIWKTLLGVERVGRHDHFFELGGHSLLAMKLIERLRSFGLKADARAIFASPLLRDFAAALTRDDSSLEYRTLASKIPVGAEAIRPEMLTLLKLTQEEIDQIVDVVPGGASNIQDIYPLLPLQEGMLFYHLMQTKGDIYLSRVVISFNNRKRLDDFLAALHHVIARHDVLRTAFLWEGLTHPVQVVFRRAELPVSELSAVEHAFDVLMTHTNVQDLRLDIRKAPLMTAHVIEDRAHDQWLLALNDHHLISDHVTLEIVMAEVQALMMQGGQLSLPPSLPFRNIVAQMHKTPVAEHQAYFSQMLEDINEPTAPFGVMDTQLSGGVTISEHERLSPEWSQRVRDCARRLMISPPALFHVAWALVLARCTGRDDVVFGTVLSGRLQGEAGIEHALGMLINTLPVRISLGQGTVSDVVRESHARLLSLLAHERASLSLAQQCSSIEPSLPLFTTLMNYRHNAPSTGDGGLPLSVPGVKVLHVEESSNYPIAVMVDDYQQDFALGVQCAEGLNVEQLLVYFRNAVESVTTALEKRSTAKAISLDILPTQERQRLLVTLNESDVDYPRGSCIHELFEGQVRQTPNAAAVLHQSMVLDYRTLNSRANQLAHYLRAQGVCAGDLVAISIERSLDLIVGLLAILKAGAAYVPLDATYPDDRLNYMLADSAPAVVLTQAPMRTRLSKPGVPLLVLDELIEQGLLTNMPADDLAIESLGPTDLAYIMYTSGSTGQPKGVMIEHRSVVRLVKSADYVTFDANTVMAQASNTSFDAATFEIWGALLNGGKLVLVEKETVLDPERLSQQIREQGINTMFMTTALFNRVAQVKPDSFSTLDTLVFGGEAASPRAVAEIVKHGMPARLVNGYGPTENTTFSTWYSIPAEGFDDALTIPIGRAVADTLLYVLDAQMRPAPIGVPGELYLGGIGLARGYLNRPELTAERFLDNPFVTTPGARLYKTGDLVRWTSEGVIEFLERNDFQVKLRGFRIELGEIEAALAACVGVRDAVVMMREDVSGDKRLVAYLTMSSESSDAAADVREQLAARLPAYMVPDEFMVLPSFPLTPNGKLDRKALPSPNQGARKHSEYMPPEGQIEQALAKLWQDMLGVALVGRNDNFFELGGHSLLAITLSVRIQEQFLVRLPVEAIFTAADLCTLGRLLSDAQTTLFTDQELGDMEAQLAAMSEEDLRAFLED